MSIYGSIGGGPAVRAAVDDFYARVLADPQLAPFFTGIDLQHLKAHQRAFMPPRSAARRSGLAGHQVVQERGEAA